MKNEPFGRGIRNGSLALLFATTALSTSAQLDCADLSIEHLYYSAFTDTAMELRILNASGTQINYPWFSVVDSELDTVARSFGSFFVLPTGSVLNHVPLVAGMTLPSSPFTGEVVLHYAAFPGDSTCSFQITNVDLCPPRPCSEIVLYTYPLDTIGDPWLFWTMRDSSSAIVGSGDVSIIDGDPNSSIDTLCIPPGNYELQIEQSPFAVPGTFAVNLMSSLFDLQGPQLQFTSNGLLPFTFFPICIDGTNAVAEVAEPTLQWSMNGHILTVGSPTGLALGTVEVFNVHGALVAQRHAETSSISFDLSAHAPGVYILRSGTVYGRTAQRFILP